MRRALIITVFWFLALMTLMSTVSINDAAAREPCAESEFLTTCPVTVTRVTRQIARTSIEGSWRLMGEGAPGTPAEDPILATFSSDGTVIVSSRAVRPALQDMPHDYTYFSTGLGVWESGDDGAVSFTVVHLRSDEAGTYLGSTTFSGTLALSAGGESVTGDATYSVFDPTGTHRATVSTPLTGERIVIEAPVSATPMAASPRGLERRLDH